MNDLMNNWDIILAAEVDWLNKFADTICSSLKSGQIDVTKKLVDIIKSNPKTPKSGLIQNSLLSQKVNNIQDDILDNVWVNINGNYNFEFRGPTFNVIAKNTSVNDLQLKIAFNGSLSAKVTFESPQKQAIGDPVQVDSDLANCTIVAAINSNNLSITTDLNENELQVYINFSKVDDLVDKFVIEGLNCPILENLLNDAIKGILNDLVLALGSKVEVGKFDMTNITESLKKYLPPNYEELFKDQLQLIPVLNKNKAAIYVLLDLYHKETVTTDFTESILRNESNIAVWVNSKTIYPLATDEIILQLGPNGQYFPAIKEIDNSYFIVDETYLKLVKPIDLKFKDVVEKFCKKKSIKLIEKVAKFGMSISQLEIQLKDRQALENNYGADIKLAFSIHHGSTHIDCSTEAAINSINTSHVIEKGVREVQFEPSIWMDTPSVDSHVSLPDRLLVSALLELFGGITLGVLSFFFANKIIEKAIHLAFKGIIKKLKNLQLPVGSTALHIVEFKDIYLGNSIGIGLTQNQIFIGKELQSGKLLNVDTAIYSENYAYCLSYQNTGRATVLNLNDLSKVYYLNDESSIGYCVMQLDGNFTVYNAENKIVFQKGDPQGGKGNDKLTVSDTGEVKVNDVVIFQVE